MNEAFQELNEKDLPGPMYDVEQRSIERRHEEQMEELEAEFRALDDEMQQYWANRQRSEMDGHMREWEDEQERRRAEDGEHFDEEGYQFEKAHMARRQELEERRMRLDQEMHEAFQELNDKNILGPMFDVERRSIERRYEARMEELEAEFQALDDEMQQYWANRQRSEMEGHMREWEDEQERRREEEGEHFDEEGFEFEKAQMDRRMELEERRMRVEEEMHEAFRSLDQMGIPGLAYDRERRTIERRFEAQLERLEDEIRAMEDLQHHDNGEHPGE